MRLSEVIKSTGHKQSFIKGKMKDQIVLEPGFTSASAIKLCLIVIEFTNTDKGDCAWPSQSQLMSLLGVSSETTINNAFRQAKELGFLRKEYVKGVGTRYFMAWERWNERRMAIHANDNNPHSTPSEKWGTQNVKGPPHQNVEGSLPQNVEGNTTYSHYLVDKPASFATAQESGDSRAASETEVSTADAVVTGMDLVDLFLSVYPLTEYMVDQSSRDNAQNETEVRRVTTIRLKQVIRDGISFDTILAGAKRYRDYVHSYPAAYVRSPQAWLAKGCWDDDPAPLRLTAINESFDKRAHPRR
jgi:hypothetical protein